LCRLQKAECYCITIVDAHLLSVVNNTIDKIGGKKYYTFIDLVSDYWQVEMDENS